MRQNWTSKIVSIGTYRTYLLVKIYAVSSLVTLSLQASFSQCPAWCAFRFCTYVIYICVLINCWKYFLLTSIFPVRLFLRKIHATYIKACGTIWTIFQLLFNMCYECNISSLFFFYIKTQRSSPCRVQL